MTAECSQRLPCPLWFIKKELREEIPLALREGRQAGRQTGSGVGLS